MLILLRSWVTPTLISSDDILCVKCFVLLQNQIASNSNLSLVSPARGHLNICYACGLSIASRRTHRVSQDCPQRNVILRWTPAHHVLHLERVCLPCWAAASRQVRRQPVAGSSQHTAAPETGIMDGNIITDMMIPVPPPLPPL
nr:uncharacterized protein LOC110376225 [Helicoverpa armigera]